MRPPADVDVLNDVNGDLVNLYRVVKNHLEEFVRRFKYALSSRDVFKWLQVTPSHTLIDIQRAARFFYLQKHAFGGKVDGQSWGTATTAPPVKLLRIEENLSAAHLRLASRLQGKAILSLNDHPDIRRVFRAFQMDCTGINYTVGGEKGPERSELLIYCWNRDDEPAGLF